MSTFNSVGQNYIIQLFKDAENLYNDLDYIEAYETYETVKKFITETQNHLSRRFSLIFTGAGTIGGIALPGIGNLIGGILGGGFGALLAKVLTTKNFSAGGTIEDIKELASSGKRACEMARRGKHSSVTSITEEAVRLVKKV